MVLPTLPFLAAAGVKKKKGFLTNMKKESMFKVPEGGKVGVIGSGQAMSSLQKKKRHEFAVGEEELGE
jgi:hypothetical protein